MAAREAGSPNNRSQLDHIAELCEVARATERFGRLRGGPVKAGCIARRGLFCGPLSKMPFLILILVLCLVFGSTKNPKGAVRTVLWVVLAVVLALVLFGVGLKMAGK